MTRLDRSTFEDPSLVRTGQTSDGLSDPETKSPEWTWWEESSERLRVEGPFRPRGRGGKVIRGWRSENDLQRTGLPFTGKWICSGSREILPKPEPSVVTHVVSGKSDRKTRCVSRVWTPCGTPYLYRGRRGRGPDRVLESRKDKSFLKTCVKSPSTLP